MTELPEPLRLANCLEQSAGASSVYRDRAAAELRRMHRELQRLTQLQMQPCAGRNCGSTNPNLHSAECFEDYEKAKGMAQPEQEPVSPKCGAIIEVFGKDWRLDYMSLPVGKHKLYTQQYTYTTPPQRTWVGLTDEEIDKTHETKVWDARRSYARAIEAKLKEKNT